MDAQADYGNNACALLSEADQDALWQAVCTFVDKGSLVVLLTSMVGQTAEWLKGKGRTIGESVLGEGFGDKVQELVEDAMWRGHDVATIGLDPEGEHEPWQWFSKAMTSASGFFTGLVGLPGATLDVPLSTLFIMRSIAEIARAHGEDISSDDTKRACLSVLAFGAGGGDGPEVEVGYWSTRALIFNATMDIAVKRAAAIFSIAMSEKLLAQLVPVAGAIAAGGLNYVFMDYYQAMARVHFTIRKLERRYGCDGAVRACFDHLTCKARQRRKVRRP